jgi:hypothetical protein
MFLSNFIKVREIVYVQMKCTYMAFVNFYFILIGMEIGISQESLVVVCGIEFQ